MESEKNHEGPTSIDGQNIENGHEKDPSRVCGLSLRENLNLDGKFPEFTGRRFLREVNQKLSLGNPEKGKSILKHRFTFCERFGLMEYDWAVRDDGGIDWYTALHGKDGKMLVVSFDDSLKSPNAKWCRRYPKGLARLDSAPIPTPSGDSIIVSGHSISQIVKRGHNNWDDGFPEITTSLIRSYMSSGKLLDRVFYGGVVQYLLPLPMGGIAVVELDAENGYLFVPTSLEPKQAEVLLFTANPCIPANRKQQKISGSVVA